MQRRISWRIWHWMVEREVFVLMLFWTEFEKKDRVLSFHFLGGDLGCRKLHLLQLVQINETHCLQVFDI